LPLHREAGPNWTFERYGATDGVARWTDYCIAGEHEDSYDPDSYLYNDVVVFRSGGEIEICGYPTEVFPPTDFHSATLVGDRVIVIGCLGYDRDRRPGFTPVYSVNSESYGIAELKTSGGSPGWIFEHTAERSAHGTIRVRGGLASC